MTIHSFEALKSTISFLRTISYKTTQDGDTFYTAQCGEVEQWTHELAERGFHVVANDEGSTYYVWSIEADKEARYELKHM